MSNSIDEQEQETENMDIDEAAAASSSSNNPPTTNQKPKSTVNYENQTKEQLLDQFSKFSKEDLIEILREKTNNPKKSANSKKKDRDFKFEDFNTIYVAFKFAYFGWNYCGYAIQPHTSPTIEEKLFDAFITTKLIKNKDFKANNYSRCGRTDRGVSSFGQVIALNVRGTHKQQQKPQKNENSIQNTSNYLIPIEKNQNSSNSALPMDYLKMLNHHLPSDIQILAVAPVPSDFDARFSCIYRTYKYFFLKKDLDIEIMEKASQQFVGIHDFRNFCKISLASLHCERSFKRRILYVRIKPVFSIKNPNNNEKNDNSNDDKNTLYEIEICGFSFLWHQIRCMVSILFLIGSKLESPSIISDLLNDFAKYPSRPQYPIASEKPLVLYDCGFEDLKWEFFNMSNNNNLINNTKGKNKGKNKKGNDNDNNNNNNTNISFLLGD